MPRYPVMTAQQCSEHLEPSIIARLSSPPGQNLDSAGYTPTRSIVLWFVSLLLLSATDLRLHPAQVVIDGIRSFRRWLSPVYALAVRLLDAGTRRCVVPDRGPARYFELRLAPMFRCQHVNLNREER